MELRKYRWSKTYEAAEVDLGDFLRAKNIEAERWIGEEDEVYELHMHPKDKKLWCAEGSILFTLKGSQKIALQAGDALDLPAYTPHEAVAGFAGCVCYESPPINQNEAIEAKEQSS